MSYSLRYLRRASAILSAGLALTVVSVAFAADIKMPAELPPYGPLRVPESPKVQSEKLANGLTVWLVQQNNLPKVAIALTVRGGYCADPADARGISDLLAATVKLGTSTLSARQIAERSQAAGGDLKAAANTENLTLSIEPLSEHVSDALALLADLATHASFPDQRSHPGKDQSACRHPAERERSEIPGAACFRPHSLRRSPLRSRLTDFDYGRACDP